VNRLSRRDFLQSSARLGGGLVLAVTLPGCAPKRPTALPAGASPGAAAGGGAGADAALTAWLRIGSDESITVIVDRSEMGQGVYTALPMLLAEELDVPLDVVRVMAAPVGDEYVSPGNGGQVTGTSNSIQESWQKLRLAGAQARVMLTAAAAKRWEVDASECRARDGAVWNARGERFTYGQLAAAAAHLPIPKDVPLKSAREFKIVGRPVPRLDTPQKVDGSAEFGIDVKLPGMLYAALAQCPVLGGKVHRVDASAAEAIPGVRKVLSTDGGVIVVADHFWQALKGRAALRIDWAPGANDRLDNAAIGALLKKAAAAGRSLSARADGDAALALKSPGARVHRAVYTLPLLAHATMEPMNCTANVRADGCDLYVGTQVQKVAQTTAATAAGLAPEQVRVFTTLLGGGFGRRLDVDFIPAAVIASKAVGAPVKLIWTREDDTTHDTYRPPALEEVSAAFDAEGKLAAWKLHIVSPSITARMFPPVTGVDDSVIEYAVGYPYDVPNVAVEYTRQEVGVDVGYMRSVSHAINCFVIESFMDELAAAAHRDPLEFRLSLLAKKPRHARVLEAVARRAGWGSPAAGRFQGIALMSGYDTYIAQVAEISVTDGELKVHKIFCALDCGQMVNPGIVAAQVEGGIVFGLSAALWGEITIERGKVQQSNFNTYRLLRHNELPVIDIDILASDEAPGGIGEPAVPLVAPAICNAIFAATGARLRALPISAHKALRV
jgi:isoquinoline 1-oxidoreductase beta subunit